MKKMHLSSRLLSLLLIVALLFSFAVPVGAANSGSNVSFKQVDNSAVWKPTRGHSGGRTGWTGLCRRRGCPCVHRVGQGVYH